MEGFLADKYEEIKAEFPRFDYSTAEMIVKISDYNKIAKLYGIEQYELKDDEFIVLCDFDGMTAVRNMALSSGNHKLTLAGKEYKSKYNECKPGYVIMSTSHTNTGIILVPDNCNLTENEKERYLLAANFNADTDEEKEKIREMFESGDSGFVQNLNEKGIQLDGMTKISIIHQAQDLLQ